MQKIQPKTKICTVCKKRKSITKFYKRNDRRIGYHSRCKQCADKLHVEWVKNNPLQNLDNNRKWKISNPKRYWCNKTINHHKDYGIKVEITTIELLNYIKDIDNCELCGKEISWYNTKTSLNSPTMDRINNEDVIDISNIMLICHQCNTTKNVRTLKEFYEYCELILKRRDKT